MNTRKDMSSTLYGINNKTYKLLFDDYFGIPGNECGSIQHFKILSDLEKITSDEHPDFRLGNIEYDIKNNDYIYVDENKEYRFDLISDNIEEGVLADELLTDERYGKCHIRSALLSRVLPDSDVITGYVIALDAKFLHSVVEYVNSKDEKMIMDWTKNLIMSKEDYVELTKFEEIARIRGSEIDEDFTKSVEILKFLNVNFKAYLVFRDEFVNDFNSNKVLKKIMK